MKTKQVFQNAKWIILCKIAQSIFQLLIGMFTARYLGPSNYGLINYAASIVAFAFPIMKLGMDAILVYELVSDPDNEGEIMGTSLGLNIVSSIICILGVFAFAAIMNPNETQTILTCILYSLCVFFAALEMIQYWFQYKLLSKYASTTMLAAYVMVSLYKVFLLVKGKNIYWFAVSHSVEYGLIGLLLLILYRKSHGKKFSFSFLRAKKMLQRSKHYLLAALMVIVIQNTDHIMLTTMIGTAENGIYAAAIASAGVVQFVYSAIIDSFRPLILNSKKESTEAYEYNISKLYCIIILLALMQSAVFTVLAPLIILILYGADYTGAVMVLRILVWYMSFAFMGAIRNIWLLAEEKQKYLPGINLMGALFNIVLNYFMIPFWGACGAAFASLMTQIFNNFLLGFLFKPLRKNNDLMLNGLKPTFIKQEVSNLLQMLKSRNE